MKNKRPLFKKSIKEILFFLIFFLLAGIIVNFFRQPEVPKNVLQNLQQPIVGMQENYSLPKSKPLIVHFWGIWCPVCKTEIPNINSLAKDYEVITVVVNSGSDKDIKDFLDKQGLKLKVINDQNGEIASSFDIGVYPTTLIYDSNGTLKFNEVGYRTIAGMIGRMLFVK
ncbi:MAG: redoxin domain-containing protein [Sulfurovaceae bacterium]|nr:redoxin domain-containing protein [Sulfurovaceae bacterium]